MPKPRKRKQANAFEKAMGIGGTTPAFANDMFTNAAARMGFGTPSLGQGAAYEMVRISYDYWQLITLYRNHWISRRIVEVPAQDMVKAWPKLTSDLEPKDLTRIDRALRKTNTKNNVLTALTWARLFGGAGGLIAIDGQENDLDQPLDLEAIGIGAYKGIIPFDRWAGISPLGDVCTDINRPLDFNKPEMYEVRIGGGDSFKVHSSRLLRFLGPTVPTPELEAQSYWGISVLEPAYESITMLDNMGWNILSLTFRANLLGMKFPELSQLLSGLGSSQVASQKFEQRMSALNHLMSNNSLIPLPADGGIESTQFSFGGMGEIFQLFQLNLAGAAQMPVTRLFGRTYNGLGQTGDGDEKIYEEKISTDQSTYMLPQLEKLYPVLCMSELGEVPDDLDLVCPSIRVLDEKEKAELAKAIADTTTVYLNGGTMSPRKVAQEVKRSSDITGIGATLDDEFIAKLSDDVSSEGELGEGLFGGEGAGLGEADSPAKAIKAENEKDKQDEPDAKALTKKAGKTTKAAPAMDALPAKLTIGETLLVGSNMLTVASIGDAVEDLDGEIAVPVRFTDGSVVAYAKDAASTTSRMWAKHSQMGATFEAWVLDSHNNFGRDANYIADRVMQALPHLDMRRNEVLRDVEAVLKAKATDAQPGERCGKPEWKTCPSCNGRIHKSTCQVKLHHDRDCCKERGCPYSLLSHGKSTASFFGQAKDEDFSEFEKRIELAKDRVESLKRELHYPSADRERIRAQIKRVEATIQELRSEARAKAKDEDGASSHTQACEDLMTYHAIPVRIENLAGAPRGGITPDGASWHINMPAHYGFIENVLGADGDNLDCYIGTSPDSSNVYVVDQYDLDGKHFDEHKVMLGYHAQESAVEDYMLGHHLSKKTFAAVTPLTMPMFRKWMATHDMKKPCNPKVRT